MAAVRGERKSIIFCNDGEKTTNTHTNTLLKTIIRVRDRESDRRESENARERARQFIRGGRPKNNGNGVLSRTRTETDNKKKKRNLVTEIVGVAFFELIEENQSEVGGGHLDKHVVLRQNNRLIIYWKNLRESETKHWKSRKKS